MRDHDDQLRQYLLGRLESEEAGRVEERLLREDDLFETAEAVEADLLDNYAHGRLAPEERERVAERLLSSPRGRSRLAVIQGLVVLANDNVIPFRKRPRFERAAALAAMLALAVVGPWLALKTVKPVEPPRVAVDLTPPPAPPQRTMPPVATPPPAQERIAETTPPETPAPPPPAAPLVLQLALSTLRGEGEIEVRNVPPDTGRVQLHLLLEEAAKDYFTSFRATVRGHGLELPGKDLRPREIGGTWTLVLELDPDLPAGMYEVEVLGTAADGGVETFFKEIEIQRNASAAAGTPD